MSGTGRILIFAALVAAAAASVSCSKQSLGPGPETVKLSVNPEVDPLRGPETKTYIDPEYKVHWGGRERMSLGIVDGSELTEIIESETVDGDGSPTITFTFTLPAELVSQNTVIGGIYPSSAAVSDSYDGFQIKLPGTQNATADSYDPAAYLLAPRPSSIEEIQQQDGSYTWNASFRRATALNELTLNGIDEGIHSVEISSPGISLAGSRELDLLTGFSGEMIRSLDAITVSYASPIPASESCHIWFTSWQAEIPAGGTLTIKVTTDNYVWTRTVTARDGGINFYEGRLNKLAVDMSGAEKTKIDRLPGEYLIGATARKGGEWILMTSKCAGKYFEPLESGVSVPYESLAGSEFDAVAGIENCVWTIATYGDWYSLECNGEYFQINGEKNVSAGSFPSELSISINADGTATIIHSDKPDYRLEYNASSPRFTTYKESSNQIPVYLIPWNQAITPSIIFETSSRTVAANAPSVVFNYRTYNVEGQISAAATSDPNGIVKSLSASDGRLQVYLNANEDDIRKQATIALSSSSGVSATATIIQLGISESAGGADGQPGWLELPKYLGTEEYLDTFFDGGDRNYTYYYTTEWYSSMWTAYPLYAGTIGNLDRPDWKKNPDIPEDDQINVWGGSYGGIYSRGHQIPNGDRNGNSTMQQQTFYATNSVPQIQNGFNGTIWANLENAIRGLVSGRDTLYVVTGPAYKTVGNDEPIEYIIPNKDSRKVPLPNYFWKAVLKVKRSSAGTVTGASAIGFWFEHKSYSDSKAYPDHAVSVDEIESMTGFDLFVSLPDGLEADAEKNSDWPAFRNF